MIEVVADFMVFNCSTETALNYSLNIIVVIYIIKRKQTELKRRPTELYFSAGALTRCHSP